VKKLWLWPNPYVMNWWCSLTKPYLIKIRKSLLAYCAAQFTAIIYLLEIVAYGFILLSKQILGLTGSLINLLFIFSKKATEPVLFTWDTLYKSLGYMFTKALFEEETRDTDVH